MTEAKVSIKALTKGQKVLVIGLGSVFILLSVFVYLDMFNFNQGVKTTRGTIVDLIEEKGSAHYSKNIRHYWTYRPVVEFSVSQRQFRFTSKVAASAYKDKIGQKVRVLYDPANPAHARLAGKRELVMPSVFLICGFMAVVLGFIAPAKQ